MKVPKSVYTSAICNTEAPQPTVLVMPIAPNGVGLSHHGDDLWNFSHCFSISSKRKSIKFSSLRFKNGSSLSDSKNARVLANIKGYLHGNITANYGDKIKKCNSLMRIKWVSLSLIDNEK